VLKTGDKGINSGPHGNGQPGVGTSRRRGKKLSGEDVNGWGGERQVVNATSEIRESRNQSLIGLGTSECNYSGRAGID